MLSMTDGDAWLIHAVTYHFDRGSVQTVQCLFEARGLTAAFATGVIVISGVQGDRRMAYPVD